MILYTSLNPPIFIGGRPYQVTVKLELKDNEFFFAGFPGSLKLTGTPQILYTEIEKSQSGGHCH